MKGLRVLLPCVAILAVACLRYEPDAMLQNPSQHTVTAAIPPLSTAPLSMEDQMRRLQASLDKMDPAHSFTDVYFVGRVVEVRQIRDGDTVIGRMDGQSNAVAIIQVAHQGATNDPRLAQSVNIAIPADNMEDAWRSWQNDNHDLLFEYGGRGEFEHIWKYGC